MAHRNSNFWLARRLAEKPVAATRLRCINGSLKINCICKNGLGGKLCYWCRNNCQCNSTKMIAAQLHLDSVISSSFWRKSIGIYWTKSSGQKFSIHRLLKVFWEIGMVTELRAHRTSMCYTYVYIVFDDLSGSERFISLVEVLHTLWNVKERPKLFENGLGGNLCYSWKNNCQENTTKVVAAQLDCDLVISSSFWRKSIDVCWTKSSG